VKRFLPLLLLCVAVPVYGQGQPAPAPAELTIVGGNAKVVDIDKIVVIKDKITVVSTFPFQIQAAKGGFGYVWDYPATITAKAKGSILEVKGGTKSTVTVSVSYSLVDFKAQAITEKYAEITFALGDVPPPPPPPGQVTVPVVIGKSYADASIALMNLQLVISPPNGTGTVLTQVPAAGTMVPNGSTVTVTLEIKPPDPPAPIPVAGLRVLMVYSKQNAAKLTTGQYAAIFGQDMRTLLESKCVVEPETMKKGYRIWETGINPSGDLKVWADAYPLAKSDPWLIISNGKGGYSGPMPAKLEDTIALVNQFATAGGGK
jgi:hypothetical protein